MAKVPDSVREAIQKMYDTFYEGYNNRDYCTMTTIFEDDSVFMPPGQPTLIGKDAITKYCKENRDDLGSCTHVLEETGFIDGEDIVFATNRVTLFDKDGTIKDTGKNINILKKRGDGTYYDYAACWNMDK